ncbi:MAG TPA: hypothetical protein VNA20_01865 [Frankiaceae bacterium]|nr:hypothetical protein [Frankiaceae bacterium]
MIATVMAVGGGAVVGALVLSNNRTTSAVAGAAIGGGFSAYVAFYGYMFYMIQLRRRWRDRRLIEKARADLDAAEAAVSKTEASEDTDFTSLWAATQKRLDYYHQIATGQAENSFRVGQVAAGSGLLVILGCAIAAAFAKSAAATVAASLLGVAGGGLAGYIGATFMRMHENASDQLRAYFLQPLEFSKILAGERLLAAIDDPVAKTYAVQTLIESLSRESAGRSGGEASPQR